MLYSKPKLKLILCVISVFSTLLRNKEAQENKTEYTVQ